MKIKVKKIRSYAMCAASVLTASLAGCQGQDDSSLAQATTTAADANSTNAQGCSPEQVSANRELAKLFRLDGDPNKAYEQMTPDYIQHNPFARRLGEVNGVSGRDEFKLLLEMKDKGFGAGPPPPLPGQPPEESYHFIMADCTHVLLLKKLYLPDPQNQGQFYEAFDFDLWRIENGKLAEHWDGMRLPANVPEVLKGPYKELKPAARQGN